MSLLGNLEELVFGTLRHARAIRELQGSLAQAHAQLAKLAWMSEHTIVHGKVTDVDAEKARFRLEMGEDDEGQPVKSPWIPYSQVAGTRKMHSAPSVNQQMTLFAPAGSIERAVALPLTWHDKNPSPSTSGSEDVDLRGKTKTTQQDASLKKEVDGLTITQTKQAFSMVVHKDPENEQEGQGETVDDEHPWKGNRAKTLHSLTTNKDGGFTLTINKDDDEKEHKIVVNPSADADTTSVEISTHKGKNKITVKKNEMKVSHDNGQHETTYSSSGIKHKSGTRVTIESSQIHHQGSLKVTGTIRATGVVQSGAGFNGPISNTVPGSPGNADDWT